MGWSSKFWLAQVFTWPSFGRLNVRDAFRNKVQDVVGVQSLGDFTTWYLGAGIFVVPPPPQKKHGTWNLSPTVALKNHTTFCNKIFGIISHNSKTNPNSQKNNCFHVWGWTKRLWVKIFYTWENWYTDPKDAGFQVRFISFCPGASR